MSSYGDLRDWLTKVEEFGELKRISGADWNLEMGPITELVHRKMENPPALLFDEIPGYSKGKRVLFGLLSSLKRLALTMELGLDYDNTMDLVKAFRDKISNLKPIPPQVVQN